MFGNEVVYIVDDDEFLQMRIELLLEAYDIRVEGFSDAGSFLEKYNPQMRGCLVLDQVLPDMMGLELSVRLAQMGATLPIIMMSAHIDPDMIVAAADRNVFRFFPKPFQDHDLVETVISAINHDRNLRSFKRRQALFAQKQRRASEAETKPKSAGRQTVIDDDDLDDSFRQALSGMTSILPDETMATVGSSVRNVYSPPPDIWPGDLDLELVLDES